MSRPWVDIETQAGVLHARAGLPDRWDLSVTRHWPAEGSLSRRRVARQIRQDIWRVAQRARGFVPRVLVAVRDGHIHITGGGIQLAGQACPRLAARIATVLDNPENRRRWADHARTKGDICSTRS